MKFLFSSLLFASHCALSSWSSPVITQTADVSVMEGETVNISCCWKGEFERITVNWLKNETHLKNERRTEKSDCSVLTFTAITMDDSGNYTCSVTVEIPSFMKVEGSGTVITVMNGNNTEDNTAKDPGSKGNSPPSPMIISLAVVAPLLIIALACFCRLRRRQAQAARVIYEVPHIDSEEADMDKHSTSSSRGSSQWCQVPVYESFDYFERVQTKESA